MKFCHYCELEIARCVCDALSGLHDLVRSQKEKMQDLARRAVACKRWRWMPGMAGCQGERVLDVSFSGSATVVDFEYHDPRWTLPDEALPDLTDPATLGCLLALVRKVWGSPMLNTVQERGMGWIVADSLCCSMLANGRYYRGDTEAEALVAALEAAP